MKNLDKYLIVACILMLALLNVVHDARAEAYSPLYDQVLDAFRQMPREAGGITVDFGVEEGRYREEFKVTDITLQTLREAQVPQTVVDALATLLKQSFASRADFAQAVEQAIGKEQLNQYEFQILNNAYDGGAMFDFGEKFEVRFRANKACYVALIHMAELLEDSNSKEISGGHILVLLPNQNFARARLEADKVYSSTHDFSIDMTASPPLSTEVVNILCSFEPFDFFDETDELYNGYYVIAPTDEQRLQKLLNTLQQLQPGNFGGTSLVLRVGGQTRRLPKKFGAFPPMGATGTTGKFFPPVSSTGTP